MPTAELEKEIQVRFINNHGNGSWEDRAVPGGTTLKQFFGEEMGEADPKASLVHVNQAQTVEDYVLQPGDVVSANPTNIKGA